MKDKNDFENIFKKLKNYSRTSKNVVSKGENTQNYTREIVVNWYIKLFQNFDTDLIDLNKDIYSTEINNIDFQYPGLVQLQITLVCMLSNKNEEYFRECMKMLIIRFHY